MTSRTASAMDEWLDALKSKQSRGPEGATARELAKAWGVGIDRAQELLRAMIEDGRVKLAGKRSVPRIDGKMGEAPVYAVVKRK